MEGVSSTTDQQNLVSSFLEIAVGQTAETARQFLQATSWKLEDAVQLFYIGNEGGTITPASDSTLRENVRAWANPNSSQSENDVVAETVGQINEGEVRAPLPVIREALYDDGMLFGLSRMGQPPHESGTSIAFRNFQEEMKRPGVWAPDQGAASTTNARDNLASLYCPPFHLMFNGPFDKAKNAASVQDRWLLVNLQSTKEFSSHMLNRDTWANEAVSQTITSNFIFWQVYDDTTEGQKVCTYYKLNSIPVVLLIDPITGLKMRSWLGMVQPDRLLEDLLPFMDGGPRNHHVSLSHKRPRASPPTKRKMKEVDEEDEEIQKALAASLGSLEGSINVMANDNEVIIPEKEAEPSPAPKSTYPPLPEEPTGDRTLLCRIGIRLPGGRRVQRNFLKTDPVQLLWSFCSSQLGEEAAAKPFRLAHAIPGSSTSLDYAEQLTLGESGLANSMISVTWE